MIQPPGNRLIRQAKPFLDKLLAQAADIWHRDVSEDTYAQPPMLNRSLSPFTARRASSHVPAQAAQKLTTSISVQNRGRIIA